MTTSGPIPALSSRPAWKALEAHHAKVKPLQLRQLFADDPKRGERLTLEAAGLFLDYSKNRVTDETLKLLVHLAAGVWPSGADRRHVPRGEDQRHGGPRGPARRPACAERVVHRRGRQERRARRPRRPRQDGGLLEPGPKRRLEGPHRQAHQERRQRRHRGLRPRAGDGLRGPAPLQRALADVPVRVERGRQRLRRGDPRPRSGRDAVRHLLEDVHDARDDDQRPHRPRLGAPGTRRRPEGRREALRGGLDQRREGLRVRHRHRQHVRLLGLGRRALLDGLGDRPLDDARHRPGELPRDARRLPRDGRALPHRALREEPAGADGPARRLVRGLLRRPDGRGAAVRPVPEALPGLPAAAHDGVQREARRAWTGRRSTPTPGRSTGASRGPTASTPSTSSSTRGRISSPATSSRSSRR